MKIPKDNILKKNFINREQIILRDFLAMERTTLANERTLFSYIRSSIYLGITAMAFFNVEGLSDVKCLSFVSLAISIFLLIFGISRYYTLKRKLQKFYNETKEHNRPTKKGKKQELRT